MQKINWSNQSILSQIQDIDPVEYIEKKTRQIVLEAMDMGWDGPPFDPIKLADKLGFNVVPNSQIRDARTLLNKAGKLCIEYNPTRPRGRQRFSIAHEIIHTFFDDCAEKIRNRELQTPLSDDNWQLEMLCNIGAAEIVMPIGSYSNFQNENFTISQILDLRKQYDVSTEAILIRYVKQTSNNMSIFCANRIENGRNSGKYKINYFIPSKSWSGKVFSSGQVLQESKVLEDCTAIGFTSEGQTNWPGFKNELYIQAVGLPPYPGNKYPRVAGIISSDVSNRKKVHEIKYHDGDATTPGGTGNKIIAHILNDRTPNWGGAGFAVALKKKYPDVQKQYKEWVHSFRSEFKLGNSYFVKINDRLHVLNIVAQKGYGNDNGPGIRYTALKKGLERLATLSIEHKASIHMPRIGVGNAGGEWELIEELINETLIRAKVNVNIYDYDPPQKNRDLFSEG